MVSERILAVEDEPAIAKVLESNLSRTGFEVLAEPRGLGSGTPTSARCRPFALAIPA